MRRTFNLGDVRAQRQARGELGGERLPFGERARDADKVQPEGGKESETAVCWASTMQRILRESRCVRFTKISFQCTATSYYFSVSVQK